MLVLKHKDGVLPNLTYMEKVLHDWLNKGVQTTEDAIKFSSSLETQFESKKRSEKVTIKAPDWLDEYMEDLAKMEG
jgi:replication initiation and membrane attachment protein